MEFVGSVTKYGAARNRGGDKVRSLTLEVFGSFEGMDVLMDKPLRITIVEEKALNAGAPK
jgi:hypothetical protein